MLTMHCKKLTCAFLILLLMIGTATIATAEIKKDVYNWNDFAEAAEARATLVIIHNNISCTDESKTVVFKNAVTIQSCDGNHFTINGMENQILCIQGTSKNQCLSEWSYVRNLTFKNGDARTTHSDIYNAGYGGAIFVQGNLHIDNCEFYDNHAKCGGAVYVDRNLTFCKGKIKDNYATENGGGIYVADGDVCLCDSEILSNTAGSAGGGVYIDSQTIVVAGATIHDNTAAARGGGIFVNAGGFWFIRGSIYNNNAKKFGGGLYISSGYVEMSNGEFFKNTAKDGAGIYIISGNFRMRGGAIKNNTATWNGGGIYMQDCVLYIIGGSIAENEATNGSGGGLCGEYVEMRQLWEDVFRNNKPDNYIWFLIGGE